MVMNSSCITASFFQYYDALKTSPKKLIPFSSDILGMKKNTKICNENIGLISSLALVCFCLIGGFSLI